MTVYYKKVYSVFDFFIVPIRQRSNFQCKKKKKKKTGQQTMNEKVLKTLEVF